MIDIGTYGAKAVAGEFGKSEKKGTEGVTVTFEILDGSAKGQRIKWDGWLTDKTAKRTIEALGYCGCTFSCCDITNLAGLGSQNVELVIEHEPIKNADGVVQNDEHGNPKMRARVKWVNHSSGSAIVAMDDGGKRTLGARMKGLVLQVQQEAKANGNRASAPAVDEGDDLPF